VIWPIRSRVNRSSEQRFKQKSFEKRFFSKPTNQLFCKTLLQHGLRDPVSGEFGKTIVFAVSQPMPPSSRRY
jgi:type I site-specific restriction endonuclease